MSLSESERLQEIARLEAAISGISLELLRSGIPYVERRWLHEDRKDLRRKLSELSHLPATVEC